MSGPAPFTFHVAASDGSDARVVLMERGADAGIVRVTEWPAGGFARPGLLGELTVDAMQRRVEEWQRAGWRFNESPLRALAWLRDPSPR